MQLNAGILGRKLSFHRLLISVSVMLPFQFTFQFFQRIYPPLKALAGHGAQFNCRNVKPTAVFRRIMDFQFLGYREGFLV
jgi:hypothetical protein